MPRGRTGLIAGILVAAIVVAAGLGVGLYLGLKKGGSTPQLAAVSSTTVATQSAATTEGPTTTAAPTTTTATAAPTTVATEATTTTQQPTTTTDNITSVLTQRAAQWMDLLESIPTSGQDKTAEIAAFLTPKDQAQARAAKYQADWSAPSDPAESSKRTLGTR